VGPRAGLDALVKNIFNSISFQNVLETNENRIHEEIKSGYNSGGGGMLVTIQFRVFFIFLSPI
jgi:hypothetical protein